MKKMSVREFRDICDANKITRFIMSSNNQEHYLISSTLNIDFVFDELIIAFNPNAICLKNQFGLICFERVKHIRMKPDYSPLGTKFSIICGDFSSSENDVCYNIIGF